MSTEIKDMCQTSRSSAKHKACPVGLTLRSHTQGFHYLAWAWAIYGLIRVNVTLELQFIPVQIVLMFFNISY